jgi:mannitol-specific phosphotransferase system IIBC component
VGGEEKTRKEKRKKKEKRSGTWVVEKKKKKKKEEEERIYNGYRGRGRSKMGKKSILGVMKKIFLEKIIKNKYLNKIELRINNRM